MSITDTAAVGHPFATQAHAYGYDLVDRLLTATSTTPGNYAYGYDNLDNATSITDPGLGSITPTYNGFNQLATFPTRTYTYDLNGNTTSDGLLRSYKWDAENRLIEIDYIGTSNKTVFAYDGLGRRTVATETIGAMSTTTRYLWCDSRICQVRNGSDVVQSRIFDEGEYNVISAQKAVYMQDQLGSVRDVLDGTTGALLSSIDYGPYGVQTQTNGSFIPAYQYAGLMFHPQSALYLSATRTYDPVAGRWINRDSIRERGGANLYMYTGADPIMYADGLGLTQLIDPKLNNPAFNNPTFQGHPTYIPPVCPDTVSIWVCTRGLGGQQGNIPYLCPLCHEFVACSDPNNPPNGLPWLTPAFGKQPRALNPDGSAPSGSSTSGPGYVSPEQFAGEPGDFSHCTEKKVCKSEQTRMCQSGPTKDPYATGNSVLNCQGWANGRSQ